MEKNPKQKVKREGHLGSNQAFPASMFKFQLFKKFYQREREGVENLNNNNINNKINKYKFLIHCIFKLNINI